VGNRERGTRNAWMEEDMRGVDKSHELCSARTAMIVWYVQKRSVGVFALCSERAVQKE
jgi:hypothetical protein